MENSIDSFKIARETIEPFILPNLKEYLNPPSLTKHSTNQPKLNPHIKALASSSLMISVSVTPELEKTLQLVCDRLRIERSLFNLYVFPKKEIEAFCYIDTFPITLGMSSGAADLNKEQLAFIIGHEIGHSLIGSIINFSTENKTLEDMIFARALEISSDRIGLLASKNIETVGQTILITLSGLDQKHIRFDIHNFLENAQNIQTAEIYEHDLYSSHPPLAQRCKALLQFSICSDYLKFVGTKSDDSLSIEKINNTILNGLSETIDSKALSIIDKEISNLFIWIYASFVFSKTKIDIEDLNSKLQIDVKKEDVAKAFNFVNAFSSYEKPEVMHEKIQSAIENSYRISPRKLVGSLNLIKKLYPTFVFDNLDYLKSICL